VTRNLLCSRASAAAIFLIAVIPLLVAAQPTDSDSDGAPDPTDNCTLVANNTGPSAQCDADGDGYGNICDADLNQSGMVTSADYTILRNVLNTASPVADLNCSGLVTSSDYTILRNRLNTAPGPSGLTPDVTAPSAPSNLQADAVSSTRIDIAWAASTDNVGVTGYQIERCQGSGCSDFAALTTVTATSYSNTGLSAATSYSYRVRATDLAGNPSGYSNTATDTTVSGTPATITFKQTNSAVPPNPQTSVAVIFTAAQTAGDLNVVAVGWYNTTAQIVSVTDSKGNDYALAAGPTTHPEAGTHAMYYAANITGAAAGTNTVTVTFNGAVPYPDVRIAEYGGIDPVNALDVGAEGSGTGALSNSGASLPTSSAHALLVGANYVTTSTTGPGSGYTARVITNPNGSILEDRVVTTTGSYNATAPLNSGGWIMQMLAFRAATVGGGGDTTPPTAPASLNANATSSSTISLNWAAATDEVGVTGYRIERCQGAGCSNFALVATTSNTNYSNSGLSGSTTYRYRVQAGDAAGNFGDYSPIASATTPSGSDTQPPTVSISSPAGGATLSGNVTISAVASDMGTGVSGVQFQVDGIAIGAPDTTSPYSRSFATAQMANGSHTISAYAWDGQRNIGNSAPVNVTFSNASPANPAQVGFWGGLIQIPLVAIHVTLMPNGRVLMWDQLDFGNPDPVIWDPVTAGITVVPLTDGTNIFCAGHTILRDGRILIVGGDHSTHVGTSTGRIFDPASNTWSTTPDMTQGRWYPTLTTLPDGRILTLSGETNCQHCYALVPEIYDPSTNTWSDLPNASRSLPWYPHAFLQSNGKVLIAGTSEAPMATISLDVGTQTWSPVDSRVFESGSAAMYAPGKILKAGTSTDSNTEVASTAVARVLDMSVPSPAWRTVASMAFPRAYHVLTMLPDGNVLVTGGGRTTGQADLPNAVYQAESWSPISETWTTLSSMHAPRLYHGTALLLPNAQVLVSGSGRGYGSVAGSDQLSAEIFSPPYLFKGPRPTITSAPPELLYNQAFTVQTPDAGSIGSVSLISLGAMTHAFNMNQTFLTLPFTAGSGSLSVTAPANGALAPPGYYMLFIINTNGVPSVAAIVRL
jgi:hypothetical protein